MWQKWIKMAYECKSCRKCPFPYTAYDFTDMKKINACWITNDNISESLHKDEKFCDLKKEDYEKLLEKRKVDEGN